MRMVLLVEAVFHYIFSIILIFYCVSDALASESDSRNEQTLILRADLTGNGVINDVYLVSERPQDGTGYFQSLVIGYGKGKPLLGINVGGKADKWLTFRERLPDDTLIFGTVFPQENDPLCCPTGEGEFYVAVFEKKIITSDSSFGLFLKKQRYSQSLIKQTLDEMINTNHSSLCSLLKVIPFYDYYISTKILKIKAILDMTVYPFVVKMTKKLARKDDLNECELLQLRELF